MTEAPAIKETKYLNFTLKSDKGNEYDIKISYLGFILLTIANDKNKENKVYQTINSIEEIKKIKYFLQFETIEEILLELKFIFNKNQNLVSIEENENQLNLIFKLPSSKCEELKIILETEKDLSNKLIINFYNLEQKYLELKNELTTEISNLKNRIFTLEKDNIQLKQEIIELKEKTKIEKIKKSENKIQNFESLIANEEDNILIKEYINPKKIIKSELLYRLSRDGNTIKKFHDLCDNQGPTLVLFKTNNGMKTGGYSPLSWDSTTGAYKNDWESFVFNLDKKEKYIKNTSSESIYCSSSYGPYFKQYGIYQKMNNLSYSSGNYTFEGLGKLFDSGRQFEMCEIEVFKIFIY
jgi:hypothetical protein